MMNAQKSISISELTGYGVNVLEIREAFCYDGILFYRGGVNLSKIHTVMYLVKEQNSRLKIFTWHIHGSYLFYLSQCDLDIYIPVDGLKTEGYYGRGDTFPFGENVIEIPAHDVRNTYFDCIIFQSERNYLVDQHEILSEKQRSLPRIYIEHNTPEKHPTNTRHVMDDPSVAIVHVTHFNKLMWDTAGISQVFVIEHGVCIPEVSYQGDIARGIVVINHIQQRGRITGWDIFEKVREHVPLDLIGMGTKESGGLGEVLNPQLPEFISHYRFFFNPIRYTSFGLAVCEAMMTGMPIVALATTEYVTVIKNGESGFIDTNVSRLIDNMNQLISNPVLARKMGANAKQVAMQKFDIKRFAAEWRQVIGQVIQLNNHQYEKETGIYQ